LNPGVAREYGDLKMRLAGAHHNDRVAYTQAKDDMIQRVTDIAKRYYGKTEQAHCTRRSAACAGDA